MRKKKPVKRKPKAKTAASVIQVTINVVAKKKPDNSKETMRMFYEYQAKRQGIEYLKFEIK